MQQVLLTLVSFVPILISFLVILLAVVLWKQRVAKRNRRTPLTRDMLRAPGEQLRRKLSEAEEELATFTVMAFLVPLTIYAIAMTQLFFAQKVNSYLWIVGGNVLIGVVATFWSVRKTLEKLEQVRKYRLGLEGEMATGQELDQLMLEGSRVFHDIPTDYGNIDHVVINRGGVYVIETKTRAKKNEKDSHDITVDNDHYIVDGRSHRMPIEQLETVQKWMQNFIQERTGMKVEVKAMLAMPGYFVSKRSGGSRFYLFNPAKPHALFRAKRDVLSDEHVRNIAGHLDSLCRDVSPSFKPKT